MKKEQDIDKIFKHGLEDPVDETAFRGSDWDALEDMLDKGKKRPGIIFWLPLLSSAAAILLFLGWFIFKPKNKEDQQNTQQIAVNHAQKDQQQKTAASTQKTQDQVAVTHQPKTNNAGSTTVNTTVKPTPVVVASHQKANSGYIASNTPALTKQAAINKRGNTTIPGDVNSPGNIETPNTTVRDYTALTAVSAAPGITPSGTVEPVIAAIDLTPKTTLNSADNNNGLKGNKIAVKKTGDFRPQYSLTILASSEMNGVGSLQKTNSGSNYGVLFSAGVKKFTLSTGVNYTLKPYSLPFSGYTTSYQFKTNPQTVMANCRMLDIPINLDYQVYNKHRNKISVGTGLSSYLMMSEDYTYNYGGVDPGSNPTYYDVKKPGKYLFSIMNLQATYQRQLNSKVGISLQPYLKIPLSNVGYSQVKLETFGVAVGLNWNINSLKIP